MWRNGRRACLRGKFERVRVRPSPSAPHKKTTFLLVFATSVKKHRFCTCFFLFFGTRRKTHFIGVLVPTLNCDFFLLFSFRDQAKMQKHFVATFSQYKKTRFLESFFILPKAFSKTLCFSQAFVFLLPPKMLEPLPQTLHLKAFFHFFQFQI